MEKRHRSVLRNPAADLPDPSGMRRVSSSRRLRESCREAERPLSFIAGNCGVEGCLSICVQVRAADRSRGRADASLASEGMTTFTDVSACGDLGPAVGAGLLHNLDLGASIFVFILAAAFLSAARHILLGASARTIAHCGCMPPQEYDRCPQTGHVLLLAAVMTGVGFFSLMMCVSWNGRRDRGYSPSRNAANPVCVSE